MPIEKASRSNSVHSQTMILPYPTLRLGLKGFVLENGYKGVTNTKVLLKSDFNHGF